MEIRNTFYFAFIPLWLMAEEVYLNFATETWKRRLLDGKYGKADSAKKERKERKKKRKVNNAFQVIW
jgi:hypothetical protein